MRQLKTFHQTFQRVKGSLLYKKNKHFVLSPYLTVEDFLKKKTRFFTVTQKVK